MTTSVYMQSKEKLSKQNTHFSRVLTSYLAMTSAQYLVNRDLLGINLVLNRMHKDGVLDFASIYDVNDQLVAQVGQRRNDASVFSYQITFQDSTAGYIQVGYASSESETLVTNLVITLLGFHLMLSAMVFFLVWFQGDLLAILVLNKPRVQATDKEQDEELFIPEPVNSEGALMVIKLIPSRLTDTHKDLLVSAVNLYGGKVDNHQEDLSFQFRQDNATFSASCSGLLTCKLIEALGPPLKIKVGLHWSDDIVDEPDDQHMKHTSYLASIGEQTVLASKRFIDVATEKLSAAPRDGIRYEPYRSSLAPDGEVFEVLLDSNQALIKSQAEQLLARR